jgi:hypothetical protein
MGSASQYRRDCLKGIDIKRMLGSLPVIPRLDINGMSEDCRYASGGILRAHLEI